eukprot:CAMPEP_0182873874 /NCGR_PEP_ID=MMETSP0034_2-20130328/12593_1 /TAXON_ID=156128 /ORGANISM="Nephroselmis pyriformis, Strain CCMP717" /LENGTH=155 /DNA_ID=CAMNT_0025006553 /DNA_START=135 /DNA_END=599 /DNA_ORIENTATION=+
MRHVVACASVAALAMLCLVWAEEGNAAYQIWSEEVRLQAWGPENPCTQFCTASLYLNLEYNSHKWDELTAKDRECWEALGWSNHSWGSNSSHEWPPTKMAAWGELSAAEQAAAASLSYNEVLWGISNNSTDCAYCSSSVPLHATIFGPGGAAGGD